MSATPEPSPSFTTERGYSAESSSAGVSVASAASAVSAAAAELGRSAFRRITAAGNQVKRGIAALAGFDMNSSNDGYGLEGDSLPPDLLRASEIRLHWLPASVLDQVGRSW
jgi:hypothetical protein